MIPFNLTASTRTTPLIQRKVKSCEIFITKPLLNFTQFSFKFSNFVEISCFILNLLFSTTALRHFKRRAMAEMNPQFTINEDPEMETQPIYLFSYEKDIDSPCSSPIPQLPNNFPDTS